MVFKGSAKWEDDKFINQRIIILHKNERRTSTKINKELTIYFSKKRICESSYYVVVYGNKCETNIRNFDNDLRTHYHEEVNNLIDLHGVDIAKRDPFQELYLNCCDTDDLLLFLCYVDKLCTSTVFIGKNDCVDIGILYKKVRALPEKTCRKKFIDLPETVIWPYVICDLAGYGHHLI